MGALLFAAVVAETSTFRVLGGAPTFLLAGAVAVWVLARQGPITLRWSGITIYVFWSSAAAVLAFFHGIAGGERYLWTLAARALSVGVFYLALQGALEDEDPRAVLRRYANVLFWLFVLNAAVAVVVNATGAPPFFTRLLGEAHPREFHHYLVTATEDGVRFISFFDEPSDLAWLGCSTAFVYLGLGDRLRAGIVAASVAASISGSLPFVYGLLLAYAGGPWLVLLLGAAWLVYANLDRIFDFFVSTPVLEWMVMRFFTGHGEFRLSRSDHFAEFLDNFSLAPHALDEQGVDAALNGSLVLLLRYGVLYLPLFAWFWLLVLGTLRRAWAVNRAMAFVLIAFAVSFFAHGSPLLNYLFWIPFEAIRRLADAESPAGDPAASHEDAGGSEGSEPSTVDAT